MNEERSKQGEIIDVAYFIKLFTEKWYWFGISLFITLAYAFFINTTSTRAYKVRTSIVINEESNGINDASAQLLRDIGFLSSSKNFANELLVLKSTPLIDKSIQSLDFQISYFEKKRFQKNELYKSSPFIVVINPEHPQAVNCEIFIDVVDNTSFRLYSKAKDVSVISLISHQRIREVESFRVDQKGDFNQFIESEYFEFKIIPNSNFDIEDLGKNKYSFSINTHRGIIRSFQRSIEILPPDLESTVAEITIKTTVPRKAVDFLNSLTLTYAENELNKKKHISVKTIEYINDQLNIIKDSLQLAEENLQQYRSRNEVIDITVQSGHMFSELSDLENQRAILEINLKYYTYIEEYFNSNQEYSELIAPSAMGIDDPMLNGLIEELINLNSERTSLVDNNQEKSPYIKKIDIRIENLKNMVAENISYYKQTNKIALEDLDTRINKLNSEVRKLPKTQRELLGYERKFNINDAIYTYLLEKKSEAEIAKASYQSDIDIIEPAEIVGGPVSPKTKMNYIIAVFLGLIIPLGVLRFIDFTRLTFNSHNEVENTFNLPVLGRIYHNNKKSDLVVSEFPKSHITESFRKVRTGLNYFLPGTDSKIISISSTVSQEGKSFISLNIANSLAIAGMKTILLSFDLRKPRMYNKVGLKEGPGLSSYLSEQATVADVIQKSNIKNLDFMLAGEVPPNPAELLASQRIEELFNFLRGEYNYIVVDTAPVGILSESYLILEKADLKIIVVRLNYTPKKESSNLVNELSGRNLQHLSLVINDLPLKIKTKYGYSYYEQ